MSTSQKYRDFMEEPMREKEVTALPGIGPVNGGRLRGQGFDKAYDVLGQYLRLKKDEERFKEWLTHTASVNRKCCNNCYNCLKEWCDRYL